MESIERLHSPRYITNGHIIAGLSTKPLLAGSDSDSSDESETPSDSANVNNIWIISFKFLGDFDETGNMQHVSRDTEYQSIFSTVAPRYVPCFMRVW